MATRRTSSSRRPTSGRCISALPWRSIAGTTMSLQTMIDSATASTITMAVAADRPPMKASSVTQFEPAAIGKASTNMSASTRSSPNVTRPAMAIGTTNRLMRTR